MYLGKGDYVVKPDQQLSPDESGTMKVQFKLQNSGNGNSYDTKYEIIIEPNLTFVDHNTGTNKLSVRKNEYGQTVLTFDYGAPIIAGELKGGIIYLNYSKICDKKEITKRITCCKSICSLYEINKFNKCRCYYSTFKAIIKICLYYQKKDSCIY